MNDKGTLAEIKNKGIPITVVGLKNAGKTTLVNWIKSRKFTRPKPTIGYNFEQVEIEGELFNIFDLSGHESFRKNMWKNMIQSSAGLIFVVDSADEKKIVESSQWYWTIIDEWLNEIYSDMVVLFLANKADLSRSLPLDKIIELFKLEKMALYGNISFQIFKVSLRKNQNISYALKWFVTRINRTIDNQDTVSINAVVIADNVGTPLYTYDPKMISKDSDLFSGLIKAISSFSDEILGIQQVNLVKIDSYNIIISKEKKTIVAIVSESNRNFAELRRISHRIHQRIIELSHNTIVREDYKKIIEEEINKT